MSLPEPNPERNPEPGERPWWDRHDVVFRTRQLAHPDNFIAVVVLIALGLNWPIILARGFEIAGLDGVGGTALILHVLWEGAFSWVAGLSEPGRRAARNAATGVMLVSLLVPGGISALGWAASCASYGALAVTLAVMLHSAPPRERKRAKLSFPLKLPRLIGTPITGGLA